jgi:hypothetical protein
MYVLLESNYLHVIWIDTAAIATKVIYRHVLRYRTNQQSVCNAMRH